MHSGDLTPMQYDNNGNPLLSLTPTTILTQNDSISDDVKLPSQSVMQCSNDELVAVACASSWGGCTLLNSGLPRALIQRAILLAAGGDMLQFNTLLASLTSQGYSPDAWKYDFRRDISALADDLYQEIQTVSLANPGRPIAIVTHSQGTLVTAAMIQKYPSVYDSGLLSNVISMGPPFAGAIDTYLYAQGWRSFLPFLSAPNTKALGQYWRSIYQLLPQWDFVTRLNPPFPTKYNIFKGEGDPKNFPPLPLAPLIPDLANPASLWSLLDSFGPLQRWYAIIGQGQATANQIVERLNDGNYKPCLTIDEEDGDGTVPLRSAQAGLIVPSSNQIYVQEVHKNLPQNSAVIGGILNILGGTSPFAVIGLSNSPAAFTRKDTIVLNSCSPVNLTVTDSSGNVISAQSSQVPNATFANIGSATQIDIPWNGTFQVGITGTGTGTFDLLVNGLGGEHSPLSYFYKAVPVQAGSQGNVIVGGTSVPTLQYNYAGKSIIDSIPANGNPPTIVCTGCYFITNNLRASFAFNVGYLGGVSAFSYNYRSATQTIQFVSTTTAEISVAGSTATFSGQGTLNGHAGYNFAVTANDLGAAGSGLDTVSITITGPNGYSYVVNASVIGGDVVVHQ
jgi:pimeloyl-ACP methyl ester carboxylesterase